MNIRIESNFNFSVSSIQYAPNGELQITLASGECQTDSRYQYTASLGSGQAEEKPSVSLLQYCRECLNLKKVDTFGSNTKSKNETKDTDASGVQ